MPRKKGSDAEEDEDYDPYESFDDDRRVRQRTSSGQEYNKSSRGRPVRAQQNLEESATDEEEEPVAAGRRGRNDVGDGGNEELHTRPSNPKSKQSKRQRWVPHNPHIMTGGYEDDEDSKDIQISDDDETGDEEASRPRRRSLDSRAKGASVPVRDETGKFVGVRPQTAAERRQQAAAPGRSGGGGGIFKSAAVTVLREEKRLMSTGEIARVALKRGYIKVQGRTPEATMASAMYTDVKRKEDRSTFIRPHEGLFGLREWAEEGVEYEDPLQDQVAEEPAHSVQRNRSRMGASATSMPRASSRGSLPGMRGRERPNGSPAYDPFMFQGPNSQANSNQADHLYHSDHLHDGAASGRNPDDGSLGLPPRLTTGLPILDTKGGASGANGRGYTPSHHSSPFGNSRGGPSVEIFKSRFADNNNNSSRAGFAGGTKRSMSGSLLPNPLRANSAGKRQRKGGPNMNSADSGNMLLLLSAVDQSMNDSVNANKVQRPLAGQDRRHPSGALRREEGEKALDLLVQGFNAAHLASVQAGAHSPAGTSHSNQVNILNLPLPEAHLDHGHESSDEVDPEGAEFNPAHTSPLAPIAQHPTSAVPPGAEAALQALDRAFGVAPLPILSSLSGALLPSFSIPSELPIQNLDSGPHPLEGVATHRPLLSTAGSLGLSKQLGMAPGSAFSAAPPSQQSALQAPQSGGLSKFGNPEEGAKRVPEVEAAVKAMERELGERHPKVGKAYLYLSRVYQCLQTPEYYTRAQQTLKHAYEICYSCSKPGPAQPAQAQPAAQPQVAPPVQQQGPPPPFMAA